MPIVIVSGRDAPQDIGMARQAGVDDYLVKPFSTQDMVRRLRNLMGPRPGQGGAALTASPV